MKRLPYSFAHWTMVVREKCSTYERDALLVSDARVSGSRDVARLIGPRAVSEDVERVYIIGVDGRNRVRFLQEIARGGLHVCSVATRDILRPAIMGHASAFLLVHNHPSGDPTPSAEDIALTGTVAAAAEIVGCPLLDHVIVARDDSAPEGVSWSSFQDLGLL